MNESRPGLTGRNNQENFQNDQEATRTANAVIDLLREMELFGNHTPKGADPIAFPLQVLSQAQYVAGMKDYETGYEKDLGERLAPHKKTLQKVEMAYEIIAYPLLENSQYGMSIREGISDAEIYPNERTDEYPHRAPIALNDAELKILGQITQDRGLPFSPEKRVYQYIDLVPRRDARSKEIMRRFWYGSPSYDRAIDEGILRSRDEIEAEIKSDRLPGREARQMPPNLPQSRQSHENKR